jgi:regulation of enolase protein 1 (concanavalin A-like superfamily)
MICDVKHHDETVDEIETIVFHEKYGDKSLREIGTAITWLYFRVWYRGGNVRVQFSFNGRVFTDLRQFHVDTKETPLAIGIYACSPFNSSFDCTFSEMSLIQDRKEAENEH